MMNLLEIKSIESGYGKKQVLFGVDLQVNQGEIVALIGPNGSGKSTVLKTICGLIPVWNGKVLYYDNLINGLTPAQTVAQGIQYAPQTNQIFSDMTIMENLEIGGFHLPKDRLKQRISHVIELFPILRERIKQEAGTLSGGEQQMLALARALIPEPKLLMLDEPSLGLSPKFVKTLFDQILIINQEMGLTFLIVEQKVREILDICQKVYSLKLGSNYFEGKADELKSDSSKLKEMFL